MFGIGITEFLLLMAIALVVLGPQRLIDVARTLVYLFGRLREAHEQVRNQLEQDINTIHNETIFIDPNNKNPDKAQEEQT